MRFLPLLFLLSYSASGDALGPALRCLPTEPMYAEPDVWLLLAGLVVCAAGRLAMGPRG